MFQTINWDQIPKEEYKGEEGSATWQTLQFEGLRIRIVNYSKGYIADHWCKKGHIVHCLEGEFISEMKSGEQYHLRAGMATHPAELTRKAFENSYCGVFVFDNDLLIGVGRAISDGAYQAAIYDIAVLPAYQGKKVGRMIVW